MPLSVEGDRKNNPTSANSVPLSGDLEPDAILAELDRLVASPVLRNSGRLCRFLRFVVEEGLAGRADQLKESVLAIEIFDRDPSYDSRVNSVVRVEARRLREKLSRYYAEDGKNDPIVISLPKGSYAAQFALPVKHQEPEAKADIYRRKTVDRRLVVAMGVICVLVVALGARWLGIRSITEKLSLRTITSDVGLTFQPALSQDGKRLTYSSDRTGSGDLDIWVQQVSGGPPLRITDNPADDVEPVFSPDGTMIAYRAEGQAEGIYLVPASGGTRTLLVRGGYHPRFSPDGLKIAYWTGERMFRAAKIFVISSRGGSPVQLAADFQYAAYPIWSPDGRYVAFVGTKNRIIREDSNKDDWDWWVIPVGGGPAIRTSAHDLFRRQGLQAPNTGRSHHRIEPRCWTRSGHIVFAARSGNPTNIWRVRIANGTWQLAGSAERLTFGAGQEDTPSISADGSMVFSVLTHRSEIWSVPIGSDAMEPRGPLAKLASSANNNFAPTVSRQGDRLTFLSDRTGNHNIWVKDLKTGQERLLTDSREDKGPPILSPDGSSVAFGYRAPLSEAIWAMPFSGGKLSQLCSDCGQPRNWLPNGRSLLYQKLSPKEDSLVGVLDLAGHEAPVVQSSESALFSPSMSPDGKWLALLVRTPPDKHVVTLIPLRDGTAAPQSAWIPITEPGQWVNKPRWAVSGNVLYYISDRDGFVCIWARRLDPVTKKPLDEPKAIVHLHTERNSLDELSGTELSVAEDKLVFNLGERSGNIWLAPVAGR